MLTQPNSTGTGVTKVEITRTGYETDWPITIGGSEQKLTGDNNTFPYTEDQEIHYASSLKGFKATVHGDTLKIHLVGDVVSPGGGNTGGNAGTGAD